MFLNIAKQNLLAGWKVALSNSRNISSTISGARKTLFNYGNCSVESSLLARNNELFSQQIRHANSFFNKSK